MIQSTETSGKNRPAAHRYQSSRARSSIRRWLLLYRPARNRAWPHRSLFYFLTFFALPVLSLAALGAYLGPDQTFGGVPAVLFVLFLAIIVRTYAVRDDATLGKSETSGNWHRISDTWPFPLEEPPPRRPLQGHLLSFSGIALIAIGLGAAGLAANGVVWPILLVSGVHPAAALPAGVTIILAIPAIAIGVPTSILAVSKGTELRDRGRRLRARDARSLLQRPGERPVLLLRSFDDEELSILAPRVSCSDVTRRT